MSYAVLFKIYYYDDFVSRQLDRLKSKVEAGDVYIWIDETRGHVENVDHDKIIRTSETELLEAGFVAGNTAFPLFWFSADYALYPALSRYPTYDYFVTVEYDAVIDVGVDPIVTSMRGSNIDFVGEKIVVSPETWYWRRTCDRIYPRDSIEPYLNMIGFYSSRAARLLLDRRKELGQQLSAGVIDQWPLSEAFIGTELARAGMVLGNLSDYGDATHLRWWPPHHESELPSLAGCAFIHPVLEGERYVDSLLADGQIGGLFKTGSATGARLSQLSADKYIAKLLPKIIRHKDGNVFKDQPLFETPEPGRNIAYGKPCTQSSLSPWSRNPTLSGDAGGAVNGLVTGTFGFHTGRDAHPWWAVDLEASYRIDQIWIFNRLENPGRARSLVVFVSQDGRTWSDIHRHDGTLFGGAFGEPLIVRTPSGDAVRFVRLELANGDYLHLDQVKIFGTPVEPSEDTK